jgi:hypothetical protein
MEISSLYILHTATRADAPHVQPRNPSVQYVLPMPVPFRHASYTLSGVVGLMELPAGYSKVTAKQVG